MVDNNDPNSKMPLDTFARQTPPGWMPGIRRYPFRGYSQLVRLWALQTDVPEDRMGSVLTGRLKGPAFLFALSLRATRSDPATGDEYGYVAPELFTAPQVAAYNHPVSGLLVDAQPSGAQYLIVRLTAEYFLNNQDLQWSILEDFVDLARGNSSYDECQAMFDLSWQDVCDSSGLTVNDV